MKQSILLFFSCILISVGAQQSYTGMMADNYVSSYMTNINPSSIVDSKTKFAIGAGLNYSTISNFYAPNYVVYGFGGKYRETSNPGYLRKYLTSDLLNLKYEINHANAIAYAFRLKTFDNLSGLPSVWSENSALRYNDNVINQGQSIAGLSLVQTTFTEHSFSYARTIFDRKTSLLKAGISGKILNGIGAQYAYFNAGEINFTDTAVGIANMSQLDVTFGENASQNQQIYKNRGLGLDIGVSYEFRPDYQKQYYDMDGAKNLVRYDINKYKWKATASITDLGWIRFFNNADAYNFTLPTATINARKIVDLGILAFSPYNFIQDSLQEQGTKSADQVTKFRMNLPTTFHGSFDWNVRRDFYVSYQASIPLSFGEDETRIKNFFIHTITPRIEKTNWSVMFPISQMGNGKAYLGGAGRFIYKGVSIFLGTNNLSIMYGKKSSFSRNIYFGLAKSILYKMPEDRDKDKVSDERDNCPDDPGLWKYQGCPDTDEDGIIDLEDHCIYIKGGKETYGCPDSDGDGIVDMNDMCPDVPGLGIHYGCPDKDMDGVIDAADRCPDVPGVEFNNGCPIEYMACCLDDDGDGVTNEKDKCPGVAGSVYNSGCPIDSTNINKVNLQKEKEKIDANNTGQQKIDKPEIDPRKDLITSKEQLTGILEKKNIIKELNVYFDVDQATLTEEERVRLENFAKKFPKNAKLSIVIIGYTDQDGSLDYNLTLSKKRAETVKRKLVDIYGFDVNNIEVLYYGESKSIHKGSYTEEMKRQDRRVEIKLVKNS